MKTPILYPLLHQPFGRFARMKALILASLAVAALHPATAQTVYRTGFEKPAFVAGTPLNGQDGWVAPPPLSAEAAVVTTEKPRIGRQTLQVPGADLVPQDFISEATDGYYEAIGSFRKAVNYDTEAKRLVRVSAYVRIDGDKSEKDDNFFSASVAVRALLNNGDTAGVGELALSSDGHVYGYSGNENVPTIQTRARVKPGKWHELAVVVDFDAHCYSFFVDHDYLGSFAFDDNNVDGDTGEVLEYTNVLTRGSLVTYAAPDTDTLRKADYTASYDQFSISALKKKRHHRRDCDDRDFNWLDCDERD